MYRKREHFEIGVSGHNPEHPDTVSRPLPNTMGRKELGV